MNRNTVYGIVFASAVLLAFLWSAMGRAEDKPAAVPTAAQAELEPLFNLRREMCVKAGWSKPASIGTRLCQVADPSKCIALPGGREFDADATLSLCVQMGLTGDEATAWRASPLNPKAEKPKP